MTKRLDLILYGATGFTGRQAAAYFAKHGGSGLRWGIAGRREDALKGLAAECGATEWIVADAHDNEAIRAMVARTQMVVSTAGPFSQYSDPVVAACVEHGAHYLDITGETPWVRSLIDRFHEAAVSKGLRILPLCGFDSVPSDLGVWNCVREIRRRYGSGTAGVTSSFRVRGGLNGGTVASALAMAESGQGRALRDPILLNPPEARNDTLRRQCRDDLSVHFDPTRQRWLLPFIMAAINTRVVRRSAALFAQAGNPYGETFQYQEYGESQGRLGAYLQGSAMMMFDRALGKKWGRSMIRRLAPKPGTGPSLATREAGFVRQHFIAEAETGEVLSMRLKCSGDPGNRVTVLCLCEAALTMLTCDQLPAVAGLLTPATGLGEAYFKRLQQAGFSTEITPLSESKEMTP